MKIAVEGCCHGELDAIYASVRRLENEHSTKIDLLLIGGDFQSIRNNADMACIAMPEKFRRLGDFAEYYSGRKTAPVLTIFIGGNHEASNYLHELFYGGWVAPNIYYLGSSNNLTYKSISLAGLSGIYKRYYYNQGHHERLPYTEDTKRSIYHIREFEVHKLSLITSPTVFMSHDWPTGIHKYGDAEGLLRRKRHFREDIERGELGSWPAEMLLRRLKPWYWFSAHLHVKFAAFVDHDDGEGGSREGSGGQVSGLGDSGHVDTEDDEGEIMLEDSDDEDKEKPASPGKRNLSHSASESSSKRLKQSTESDLKQSTEVTPQKEDTRKTGRTTRFLALDKCLPHRDFLQILDIDPDPTVPYSDHLSYSPEWLAITRTFHPYLSTALKPITMPSDEELRIKIEENLKWVKENVKDLRVPENFEVVAPVHDDTDPPPSRKQPPFYENPQTVQFCRMLDIDKSRMPR